MRVLVTTTYRMAATRDGRLWVRNRNRDYAFWRSYLDVYDAATLLVRANAVDDPPPDWHEATGPGVRGVSLPDIHTPVDWLRKRAETRHVITSALADAEAVHLHGPDIIPQLVWPYLRSRRPYAMEVAGDPWDAMAPRAARNRLRPVYRRVFTRALRRQCAAAVGASYVTAKWLQQRYPCPRGEFGVSDVQLSPAWFIPAPRAALLEPNVLRVITVCELAQPHKCVDALIAAVAACRRDNYDVRLTVVGEGRLRTELEDLASSAGVSDAVRFLGHLASVASMQRELDAADLFALPSRQEGLPRALVEAMARGLPCLASPAGGIPEVLPAEAILPAGDATALAARFQALLRQPQWLAEASARNLRRAADYAQASLAAQRRQFMQHVRQGTQQHLQVGV